MPIEKVKYENLFPTVQYGNELFSMEGTVGEGETIQSLYDSMFQMAKVQHERNYPFLSEPQSAEPTTLPIVKTERIEGLSVVEQIGTVKELKVLEGYRLLVKNNPEWLLAYNNKLKELSA